MTTIIVGSTAAKHWWPDWREPKDLDMWVDETSFEALGKLSGDVSIVPNTILPLVPRDGSYASPDALYTIKAAHLGWDIFWEKHVADLLVMKMKYGCKLVEPLYTALVAHWKQQHGNKDFLSLYKDKTQFFNDYVTYVYDHDYLHELVAYPNRPVYESCLEDGQEVAIDKAKFDMLPFEVQVRMFKEEISVIAAERWLINPKTCGKIDWKTAYRYSLRKTVTALTKNWATEFIVLNMEHFIKPDYSYFEHMFSTIDEGEKIMGKKVNEEKLFEEILASHTGPEMVDKYDLRRAVLFGDGDDEFPGLEHIEQEGGGEGGGEYCHSVFKWKDVFYMATYSYYSYQGFEYDYLEVYEVTPKEKTITVYE